MRLIDLLPEFYNNGRETAGLQEVFGVELTEAQMARDDCFLQLDVNTATWGLDLWEEAYGIPKEAGKPLEYRRTRIISKMRGAGTTTAVMIKNVAESFSNGSVEVDEIPNENRFDVRFVGTLGIPPNMDDLTSAIEEIKPAHLAYGYIFIWRTHGQLGAYTHGRLAGSTYGALRGGKIA